jgi:3-hydroxyacyl-CoA dehydrogenase
MISSVGGLYVTSPQTSVVRIDRQGAVALIIIDNPPVNASSQAVRQGLLDAVVTAEADPAVDAIVIACDGRTFVAGADVREFGRTGLDPILPVVVQRIEDSTKPVVAAIHGTALGGGFEIALACHARVMARDAAVGLPEVKLGLIPGASGTQRLPRLIGMLAAVDIITSGRRVAAPEALTLGIADQVAGADLRGGAAALASSLASSLAGQPLRRLSQHDVPAFDPGAFDAAAATARKKARGQIAPGVAADVVKLAATLPFAEAMAKEREAFMDLVATDQSKALRHAFFAEREVTRVPHLEGVTPRSVGKVGIIGAGTMGAGIAVAFADAGFPVTIVEMSAEAAEAGRKRIAGLWERQIKSGRITAAQRDEKLARVTLSQDYAALADADLVVEAAFEEMPVKKEVFGKLVQVAKPGAVLASNTSYLDVNEIGMSSGRPADTIGLHFFSPANIMRLVEVIEPSAAGKDAVATGVAVAKKLGKIPVVCGVCDGFVGNRILAVWRSITDMMIEDGALPQEIDAALESYGMAMGPFAVADLSGLDIGWARRKRLAPARDPNVRYASTVADRLCEAGRFGQKTGAGWYVYPDGKRTVDPFVTGLIEQVSAEKGITRRPFPAETIERMVRAAMVNEGARILSEGIVPRALDIDVVLMTGYGFPGWRGGPMFEADQIGLDVILADFRAVQAFAGPGYEPALLLEELAQAKRKFADVTPAARG